MQISVVLRHRLEQKSKRNRDAEAGFTLVEMLVVMAILVLLASMVAPRVIGYVGGSRTKAAKVQIEGLITAMELFKLDTGRYPNESEGIHALIERPAGIVAWNGPYLKKDLIPVDPWGTPYRYRFPGQFGDFDIYSLGADIKEGGEGEDKDVASWR
jgi:general secretion pathway protein G